MRMRGGPSPSRAARPGGDLHHRVVEIVRRRGFEPGSARGIVERAGAEAGRSRRESRPS